MEKNKNKIFRIILLTVLFFLLNMITVITSKYGMEIPLIGKSVILKNNIPGIVSILQVVISIMLVLVDNKRGIYVAIGLLLFSGLGALGGAMRSPQTSAILGTFMSFIGIMVDILLYKQLVVIRKKEKILEEQAVTDSLTGLLNRRGAFKYLNSMIASGNEFYLLFLDLDNFKEINDTMGHKVGDYLLKTISEKWTRLILENGIVARTGGDEFLIIVPDDGEINIEEYMQRLIDVLGNKIRLDGNDNVYEPSVSIGSSHFPKDADNAEDLIKYADMAMYEAKLKGKKRSSKFSSEMKNEMEHIIELEMYIKKALKDDGFYMVFQPQFSANDKKIRGFEALLRLNDEHGKPISPAEFIPIAEKSSLILDIDYYVLNNTLKMCKPLVEKTGHNIVISINISAKNMVNPNFVDEVKAILEEHKYPPECLELEITEYCYVQSVEQAVNNISGLNKLGVKVALDDFGTGYASLSYLSKMPMDVLKVDKCFIDNLGKTKDSKIFVDAMISMGHTLGCKIVSEGVEKEEQLQLLRSSLCDYIQGYIWSKPVSFDTMCEMLEKEY